MGSYKRKLGTVIVTTTVHDKAMNKRGISKLVQVIPAHPVYKSREFARALASLFGPQLLASINKAETRDPMEHQAGKMG